MKKPFAITMTILAVLLVTGAVVLFAFAGADIGSLFGQDVRTIKTWVSEGPVSSITIETSDDNVVFRKSEDGGFSVTYYENANHTFDITLENGTFSMINKHSWLPSFGFGRDYELTVFIPEEDLEKLDVKASSGNVDFNFDIRVGSLAAGTSSGNITLGSFTAETLSAGASSGNIAISSAAAGSAEVRVSSGNITLTGIAMDSLKTNVTSGRTRLENCTVKTLDMHSTSGGISSVGLVPYSITAGVTSGNVDLELSGVDAQVYRMDLSSTSGSISVNGGGYETKTSGALTMGSGTQVIRIGVTSGNITVRFPD